MTTDQAIASVFEAAEYALENDTDYIADSTEDNWTEALKVLRDKKVVALSPEAYWTLCGLVQPISDEQHADVADGGIGVNHNGIHGKAWIELRVVFPVEHFCEKLNHVNYNPEAS